MGLRAGLLNEYITFRKRVITRDDFGEQSSVWQNVISTRARVVRMSGNRIMESNEVWHPTSLQFIIRSYHIIDNEMEIVYNGNRYNIVFIDVQRLNQLTTITAELINE